MENYEQPKPARYRVETYESQIGNFENWVYDEFYQHDLDKNDRIVITTKSGNRYFLRFSQNADGWKLYNESKGGFEGVGYKFRLKESAKGKIAKRGEIMTVGLETPEGVLQWSTTEVDVIEARKGVEEAVQRLQEDKESNFGLALGQMFKDAFGAQSQGGDSLKRAEEKFRKKFDK